MESIDIKLCADNVRIFSGIMLMCGSTRITVGKSFSTLQLLTFTISHLSHQQLFSIKSSVLGREHRGYLVFFFTKNGLFATPIV